jgi:hypothetical protein
MKHYIRTTLNLSLGLAILALIQVPLLAVSYSSNWTDAQYRAAFDETARNFGAAEYATYTFMTEFGRSPHNLKELIDTGHLNVLMTNPYTGGEVLSLEPEDYPNGHLAGNMLIADRDEGKETHIEAYYVRKDREPMVHSMIKRIYLYTSSVDHAYLFENDLPRDEQFTAVYCMQAIDALESFQQKIGKSPDSFEDMYTRGDVNVHYINPVTGDLAVSTEDISAGDFFYGKIGDEGYELVGWGRDRPVFFATTDEATETAFYLKWPQLLAQ